MSLLAGVDHSITLYWVITCCGWVEGEALGCMHRRLTWSKDVLFEKILTDKFFQVSPEALAVNDLMFFTIVIRTIFFYSEECRVTLDRAQASHPRLVFDGIKNFVEGEPQRSELMFHLEGLG